MRADHVFQVAAPDQTPTALIDSFFDGRVTVDLEIDARLPVPDTDAFYSGYVIARDGAGILLKVDIHTTGASYVSFIPWCQIRRIRDW